MAKYFKPEEFKCSCCGQLIISEKLISTLDAIREIYKQPMIVTSGYRCAKHNAAVGGKPDSEHLIGTAADISCTNSVDRFNLTSAALSVGVVRIGIANTFVHIGVSDRHLKRTLWLY